MKGWSTKLKLWMGVSILFVVLMGFSGVSAYKTLEDKAFHQRQATAKLERWKSAYHALQPASMAWNETFMDAAHVKDLLRMYKMLRLEDSGLFATPEKLQLESIERVRENGVDIGLNRACLYSHRRKMKVYADSFENLIAGIIKLAGRKDVYLGEVEILLSKKDSRPTALLNKFCVLFKDSEEHKLPEPKVNQG